MFKRNYLNYILFSLLSFCFILILGGCATIPDAKQDTRTMADLAAYFKKCDMHIDKIMPVRYQAILASDGLIMFIDGVRCEFYVYDVNKKFQKKKLDKIIKNKAIMVLGYKIPAITNGRFVMLDNIENPDKIKIIRAFRKFPISN